MIYFNHRDQRSGREINRTSDIFHQKHNNGTFGDAEASPGLRSTLPFDGILRAYRLPRSIQGPHRTVRSIPQPKISPRCADSNRDNTSFLLGLLQYCRAQRRVARDEGISTTSAVFILFVYVFLIHSFFHHAYALFNRWLFAL